MQPEGPYRFTHLLGGSPVGKAWAAIDEQGRFVSVAVLDAAVAATPGWRDAFAGIADALAQSASGPAFTYADFSAAAPWVAYPAEAGPGAEKLIRALGVEYHPVPAAPPQPVSGPPQPVSSPPQPVSSPPQPASNSPQSVSGPPQSVSGPPQPITGMPHAPWAVQGTPIPRQPILSDPHPVSGAPTSAFPASGVPASGVPASGVPASGVPASGVPASGVPASAAPAASDGGPASGENLQMSPTQASPAEAPPFNPFVASERRIKPSEPPRRPIGLWVAVAALLSVAALGGGAGLWAVSATTPDEPAAAPTAAPTATAAAPGIEPWAAAAPRSPDEHALATAAPSMVFLEVIISGYARNAQDGTLLHAEPFTFSRRCSGVIVNRGGHVLTNGQCVKPSPETMRDNALAGLAKRLVAAGQLKPADVEGYTKGRAATTVFTGRDRGTEPDAKLYGQLNVAIGDVTNGPAIPGTIVRALPLAEGNLALVALDQADLPVAELNTSATIAPDTALLILGYGTTDTEYRSATYTVRSAPVRVTEVDPQSSVYRINADVGVYSRGGIAIDQQGRVVGMLDHDLSLSDDATRLVVPVATISGLLGAAGIENGLGEPDRLYRSGLDAYFAGDEASAVPRFEDVVERVPSNVLARAYREAAAASDGKSSRPGWAVPLLVAAGVALAGGIGMLVVWRRRRNSW
ncbi:trypsin-like peptidase domain-containing protein [Micromonospora sp. NBC_00362]|uniref:trypsin-like peptidase domain-containing protein n=1 Tax=Micromonospora sp. NBC_00362 TaxID=2975975 RepID=UPI00224D5D1A|nr:trypsin-like peptidase domain-containing protein [Micromonospora sp. NBC_00362]MCX5118479.1 trypsin-like peptidase domain-containing protein [Micromonospora sp. NBC_00362]